MQSTTNAGVTLTFDASSPGTAIPNLVSDINMWHFGADWLEKSEKYPNTFFQKNMPFVRYVQFMTATGGSEDRDLFRNPKNKKVLNDYDFRNLIRACGNVVKKGLKPYIKTGNIPLKLSKAPVAGTFGVNVMPPDNYEEYGKYMTAMATALCEKFGAAELLTWRWGVFTEFENRDWFTVNEDPVATKEAFIKIYDYTVSALQKVIGANVYVGAHSMTVSGGLWDECEFIEHCANGTNACTGKKGTRLCFLAASYYDMSPAVMAGEGLARTIKVLQDKAAAVGFTKLDYGIDEGRILLGTDGKALITRTIGQTMQASGDARIFKIMLDNNINYFSAWGYTTEGIWDGIPSVAMHTANLLYRMVGTKRIPLAAKDGKPAFEKNDIDGFAGIDTAASRIYVMAYAYTPDMAFDGEENVRIEIKGVAKAGPTVRVTQWIVSDACNFFDEWIQDRTKAWITDESFAWSRDSFQATSATILKNAKDREFFASRTSRYRTYAELQSSEKAVPLKNKTVTIDATIPHHGVLCLEIK